jgi:hypothetical protein
MMMCFFGALSTSMDLVAELPIRRRERRGGVTLFPYVMSKAAPCALLALLFPLSALIALRLVPGDITSGPPLMSWVVLAPMFFASACVGLFISSLVKTPMGAIMPVLFYTMAHVVLLLLFPGAEMLRSEWVVLANATLAPLALIGAGLSLRIRGG